MVIGYNEWPNKIRKIWYGDNEYSFWEAKKLTNELGFDLIFKDYNFYLVKI